jgi:energy-coupling factor transporter ATP-binding protein EcfA2
MDRQAADYLHAVLSDIEPELAASALEPLQRLVARPGAGDALIVAVVGTSGVGKSRMINLLAGTRVVTAGPLRPTTTEIAVWGDIDAAYLPGRRVPGPNRPDRLVLIDTPPVEHYPDIVASLLYLVDAVIFVISPDRYADAVTAALLDTIREGGVPARAVFSAPVPSMADLDLVVRDAEVKLRVPVEAVVTEDIEPLRTLLTEMVHTKQQIVAQRDQTAATMSSRRAKDVADVLFERVAGAQREIDRVDAAFAGATIDRAELASAADLDWDQAAISIDALAREATDDAIAGWRAEADLDGFPVPLETDPTIGLPDIDPEPIMTWHQSTDEIGRAAIKRRWLHPRRTRAVRDQLWRLSIDFARHPTKPVRKALREQLADLRTDRNEAFVEAVRRAGAGRIETLKDRLDPLEGVTPEEITLAANALIADEPVPSDA